MNYQPGYHKVEPGQKCRILTIQVAVPANAHPSDIADEMTSLLTTAIADEHSGVMDWQYVPGCGPENANFAVASDEPVEGEIFYNDVVALRRTQMLEAALLDCLNALKDAATVADAGDGENYAYQHEIEAAEAVLTDDPTAERPAAVPPACATFDRHTPGLWQVESDADKVGLHPYHNWRYVTSARKNGEKVTICQMMDSERMAYDARLIAAAPHMKALLKLVYRYLAVMAENIQTVILPQAVMGRIDELMAQIEYPLAPWEVA